MSARRTITSEVLTAWCPTCREQTMPRADGVCLWCDTQTGGSDPAPIAPVAAPAPRVNLVKGDDGWGPDCPECGGPKHVQSRMCWTCRQSHGHRSTDHEPRARRLRISVELLEEARRLYATGLSFRQVAAQVWDRTHYKTPASCAEGLYRAFVKLDWPRRPQAAVTAARNYKPGRGHRGRDEGAYRRFVKERDGRYQPRCSAVRTQYPRKGHPCCRPAMVGSSFCQSHDPAREADRVAHLERMRSRLPERIAA